MDIWSATSDGSVGNQLISLSVSDGLPRYVRTEAGTASRTARVRASHTAEQSHK